MDYSSAEWFESLKWQHRWIEYMVGWWVGQYGKPKHVCDFGAGDGWWPFAFKQIGAIDCFAVELHKEAEEHIPKSVYFVQSDLRNLFQIETVKFDLSICLEVAEHIPENCADTLALNLVRHTGDTLLFSAAGPGQKGTGHINLKPQEYWRKRLTREGVVFSPQKTGEVWNAFEKILGDTPFSFFPRNVMVFARVR
jgi:hypothetical protein